MNETKKIAVVSGASRGIGAAIAEELGRRGHHVIVNYLRSADAAAGVVAAIEAAGGSAQAVQADVCDEAEVTRMVEQVHGEHGRIDVLVVNANTAQPPFEPLEHLRWDAFAAKVNGELSGAFFLTQQVLAIMREQRSGRIAYISSTAADVVGGVLAHSTAKAALNTFSRHVAADAARYGVTVNTVALGMVATDATSQVFLDALKKHVAGRSVLGRVLEPADVARSVALVVDDGFGAAAGQVIRVDGGFEVLEQQLDGVAALLG